MFTTGTFTPTTLAVIITGSEKITFDILITGAEFSATVGELQVVTLNFEASVMNYCNRICRLI